MYFLPDYAISDFTFPPSTNIFQGEGLGWNEWKKVEDLLAHAEQNGDAVTLDVCVAATVSQPCPDFSQCLNVPIDVSHALWHRPDLVTLQGEDGYRVQIPWRVLKHHSAVLAAALQSRMIEGSSNVVKMPDVSEKVLDSLEDCLHECGLPQHLAEDWHGLLDLLVVAKKYEIQNLVDACTFFLSCALTGENVSELLLKADKYRLTKLLRAAMYFAVGSDMAHSAVLASDEFEAFPSELLRLFVAYQKVRKTGDGNLSAPPPFFQWGNVPEEFGAGTDWKSLDKCSLRRACFERGLGTEGSVGDLVDRLTSPTPAAQGDDAAKPAAKRHRSR
eukprot:TRINITY_DN19630_c0_g1_i2.p1 TRINITY_DN19630_c0_g1~~TRINITY_DN19630_c0_g1_i2.p1  ORF type:complete len:331 (+),score=58.16 TRINITY_DN19630_c0_g1_i2:225-1217(+)